MGGCGGGSWIWIREEVVDANELWAFLLESSGGVGRWEGGGCEDIRRLEGISGWGISTGR